MKVYWRQTNSEGPAVMVFTNNAEQMAGLWWFKGNEKGNGGLWDGKRKSMVVGSCPHWSGGIGKQMHEDLSKRGTSRVYGINFDSDSDVLKNESKTVLDEVVAMLKSEAAWKIEIDGHTDSTATAAHNQQLSERRAESVKTYLVAHGIDSARLTTRGFGATQPVAPNETDIGRAQNRRVELVKK